MIKKDLEAAANTKINSSPESVWDALVNPEKIKVYLFGTKTTCDWMPGSEIVFEGEYQGQQYRDKGRILGILKNELLQYTYWSGFSGLEDKEENYSQITFRLKGNADSTQLQVDQKGFKDQASADHSAHSWANVLLQIKELVEKSE